MEPLSIDVSKQAEIDGLGDDAPETLPVYMNDKLIGTAYLYVDSNWSYMLVGLDGKGFRVTSKAQARLELNSEKTKAKAIVFYYKPDPASPR